MSDYNVWALLIKGCTLLSETFKVSGSEGPTYCVGARRQSQDDEKGTGHVAAVLSGSRLRNVSGVRAI